MSVSLAVLLAAGVLIACGVYLVLERTLTRVVLGFVLLGNGINLLFVVAAGTPGAPPFEGSTDPSEMTDPMPFAMVLTAIVISLGVTAFGMALAHRAWQLFGHDEVPDDVEDRRVLRRRRGRSRGDEDRFAGPMSEQQRQGALRASQLDEDPLGGDLSSATDAPQDPTESDEGVGERPDEPLVAIATPDDEEALHDGERDKHRHDEEYHGISQEIDQQDDDQPDDDPQDGPREGGEGR